MRASVGHDMRCFSFPRSHALTAGKDILCRLPRAIGNGSNLSVRGLDSGFQAGRYSAAPARFCPTSSYVGLCLSHRTRSAIWVRCATDQGRRVSVDSALQSILSQDHFSPDGPGPYVVPDKRMNSKRNSVVVDSALLAVVNQMGVVPVGAMQGAKKSRIFGVATPDRNTPYVWTDCRQHYHRSLDLGALSAGNVILLRFHRTSMHLGEHDRLEAFDGITVQVVYAPELNVAT